MSEIMMFEKEVPEVEVCKGLFWRASVSSFLSSYNSIEVRKSLRLLKRKSCPGCKKCDWLWEYFSEDIPIMADGRDYLGKLKDGATYTFQVHTSRGFEDLYDEIDSIDFIEVKEIEDGKRLSVL